MKRTISTLLSLVFILSSILVLLTSRSVQAESGVSSISFNRLLQDKDNTNLYYFVGMVYYEVWSNSAGNWTGEGNHPGSQVETVDGGIYEFTFASNRKIKSIEVEQFNYDWKSPDGELRLGDLTFEKSRAGELKENPKSYYQNATSSVEYKRYDNTPVDGVGTNKARKKVHVKNGVLLAKNPIDRRNEEIEKNNATFAPKVEGWRYYFPTLFKIELEPAEGMAIIQHFDTKGNPLHGIDGFTDKEMKLEKGKDYTFPHTAPGEKYTYEGHKKSTREKPKVTGGSRTGGDPAGFKYDGTFPNYYVYYYYKLKNPEEPNNPDIVCTRPEPGQTMEGESMNPAVRAMIKADQRGSEPFDVLKGIPTSESLYGNVFALDYLFKNQFVQMTGTCTYTVVVETTWTLTWTEEGEDEETPPTPMTDTEVVPSSYTVVRPYSYWTIAGLSVYNIEEAILENYAFFGEQITINPSGYTPPDFTAETTGDFYPAPLPEKVQGPPQSKDGEDSRPDPDPLDFQDVAEAAIPDVQVENDSLVFKGQTIMDKQRTAKEGTQPGQIPEPEEIDQDVLYSPYNYIPSEKTNKKDQPSTGQIRYTLADGSVEAEEEELAYDIAGINTVTVHTPVVNYSLVSDDQPHNQKTVPNMNRSALILERPFTVRMPTSGQHLDVGSYPGYGNRDYAKYYRIKQVSFPFDVYSEDRAQFYPRNTWIDVPVHVLDTTFYLPVWVDEGDYQVQFRNIAENAPDDFENMSRSNAQPDANTDLTYHLASDEVSVEVIGRLYDFEITDIADYNWELVFRRYKGSIAPTWISYWTGTQDIDGDKRGNFSQFTVPIRPGSHPLQGYKNVAVKTGYHFKFDFKTKGNMFGPRDGIRLTPTFDFVSKDGKTRVPVDLYYSTNQRNFIRIGSAEDQVKRFVILNDRMRQVPAVQLRDTATYKYNRYGEIHPGMMSEQAYQEYYRDKFTKMKTPVGGYSLLLMPEQLRTFIGPKTNIPVTASADVLRANAAIQQWYGEYSLPAEPYVVEAGTNLAEYGRTHGGLDAKSPIFLKNGYIVVNFNLESIREGNLAAPHLQYIHAPLMNQWLLEGFQRQVQDSYNNSFTLRDGDVVFYHADRSSRDDFSAQVPH
ncbi:DUF5704 domain-containing protein [Paenibacillus silvae]|uniref:DUF5704 domain-containing protein n=1 Tax=Paenibacillus silvae TaxID=1325358 RepID=UPI002004B5A4|nr:DUF5704 domain-containing protein [Paenibacillus silvae]MCK6077082.1 bacterial surface protein [Paenibacillus silvae]MCK6151280.1 bacterial surface protein [Paenibacillus silvae]MCK6269768.1 bacterial surface protein [Paenibacillus silvae]